MNYRGSELAAPYPLKVVEKALGTIGNEESKSWSLHTTITMMGSFPRVVK